MEKYYQDLHRQVQGIQFRYQDLVDRPDHPTARVIQQELRHLEDDIQTDKRPRSVEERLKTIQNQLLQSRNGSEPIMDDAHSVAMQDHLERIRRDLRKLPEY